VGNSFGDCTSFIFWIFLPIEIVNNLNRGDFLIDDRLANGTDKFEGEHLHFGTEKFPTWEEVLSHLLPLK